MDHASEGLLISKDRLWSALWCSEAVYIAQGLRQQKQKSPPTAEQGLETMMEYGYHMQSEK